MTKTSVKKKAGKKVGAKPPEKDLRSKLKELIEVIEKSWFQVSVRLSEIYSSDRYKSWGFEKFEEYVLADLGMEYRTAMWRVGIGKAIKNMGITEAQVSGMGWTKFKELSLLINDGMTKKQFDKILTQVKGKTYKEIADFVRNERNIHTGGEPLVKKVTLKFGLTGEQADVVEQGLDRAKELANTDEDSIALEYIVMEWMLSAKGKEAPTKEEPETTGKGKTTKKTVAKKKAPIKKKISKKKKPAKKK